MALKVKINFVVILSLNFLVCLSQLSVNPDTHSNTVTGIVSGNVTCQVT